MSSGRASELIRPSSGLFDASLRQDAEKRLGGLRGRTPSDIQAIGAHNRVLPTARLEFPTQTHSMFHQGRGSAQTTLPPAPANVWRWQRLEAMSAYTVCGHAFGTVLGRDDRPARQQSVVAPSVARHRWLQSLARPRRAWKAAPAQRVRADSLPLRWLCWLWREAPWDRLSES